MICFLKGSLLFLTLFSFAIASAAPACYTQENDPQTKRPYQNEAQWQADREALWQKAPASPSLLQLYRGYQVARLASAEKGLGSDKRKHCYVGCRIAAEVSFQVAEYAGYYKEDKDLTDCNPRTQFDFNDINATVIGAEIAARNPGRADQEYCKQQCRSQLR